MAESADEVRKATEEARSLVADKITALGDKAEVGSRVGEVAQKGALANEQLTGYAAQAKTKVAQLRDQATEQIPQKVGPALEAVAPTREAAASAVRNPARLRVAVVVVLLALAGLVVLRRLRGSA